MYSCANYPRGCRGRVNTQGGKCADCVVCTCGLDSSKLKYPTNRLTDSETPSTIFFLAFCAAPWLSQSPSLRDLERLAIPERSPRLMSPWPLFRNHSGHRIILHLRRNLNERITNVPYVSLQVRARSLEKWHVPFQQRPFFFFFLLLHGLLLHPLNLCIAGSF